MKTNDASLLFRIWKSEEKMEKMKYWWFRKVFMLLSWEMKKKIYKVSFEYATEVGLKAHQIHPRL